MIRELLQRMRHLLRRNREADDLAEEMRLHVHLRTQRNVTLGLSGDEARQAAQRRFGNTALQQENAAAIWLPVSLDQLLQDLKFGTRWLLSSPGFTAVVVLTLAIGIGVNTAMFSVVNAVLLRPLPYPTPDRLVWIANSDARCSGDCFNSRADFTIWEQQAPSFAAMAAYGNLDLALVVDGRSTTERVAFVTDSFWKLSGAPLQLGRLPKANERGALVLSWPLFERQFGARPEVLGRKVKLDGQIVEITGVLRSDFRFLFPQELYTGDEVKDIDAYAPLLDGHEAPGDPIRPNPLAGTTPGWVRVVGRLKEGASVEQARAELTVIHEGLNQQFPSPYRHKALRVIPLIDRIVGEARLALLVLLGAVGFVLVIACANVANLLLARASVRRKEIAIRAALGAGRARILRQFATESVLLASLGGIAGILLAKAALIAVIHWGAQAVPRVADTEIDATVLTFTLVATLITGLLFGLAPAAMVWRVNLDEVLREDAKGASSSGKQQTLRAALVSAELALAVILLTGAGLMLRSFWRMNTYPDGFAPDQILVLKLSLAGGKYHRNWPVQDVYLRQLLEKLSSYPGVEAAGIECGAFNASVRVESGAQSVAALRAVSPGYLRALGIGLTRGRWPTQAEELDTVLVNQSLAWNVGGDLTDKRIAGGFLRGSIAGVVADFKDRQLDAQPAPQVFIAYQKSPIIGSVRAVVRTTGSPLPLMAAIRKDVESLDPDVPIHRFQTLEQELQESIASRRFNMVLLAAFALTALLLALVGIYGVMTYIVAQRTREIGIRMSLGARRTDIVGMVARSSMRIAFFGLLAGLAAAFILARIMTTLIYDLDTTDPATFAAVGLTLCLTAFLACCRPAYQASRLDPLTALRHE